MSQVIERLERRTLLHASLDPNTHVLTITGVAGSVADTIDVTDDGTNIIVNHVNDSTMQSFARASIAGIVVNPLDGNNVLTIVGANIVSSTINGGNGNDSITAAGGRDLIFGGSGNDTISGGGNDDAIDAGAGNDSVNGGADNDTLVGGPGTNTLAGGQGNDTVSELTTQDALLSNTLLQFNDSLNDSDSISAIERARVTSAGVQFAPHLLDARLFTLGPVTLIGAEGDDRLWGTAFDDLLECGNGRDEVHAGQGNDVIDNDNSGPTDDAEQLFGDGGTDKLVQGGILPMQAPFEALVTLTTQAYTAQFTGPDILVAIDSIEGVEISGGGGDDTIDTTSYPLPVTVDGGGGDDTVTTSIGDDVIELDLIGGSDSIDAGAGNDRLVASADVDMVLTNSAVTIGGVQSTFTHIEAAELDNPGFDAVTFTAAAVNSMPVTLSGGAGNDTLIGGGGPTQISGHDGNDVLRAGNGGGAFNGDAGDDSIIFGVGNSLTGMTGASTVDGGDGSDTLILNDTAYTGPDGFTLNAANLRRVGLPLISYFTLEGITINIGAGSAKTHTVNNTLANCPVRFNPAGATDTFDILTTNSTGTAPVSIEASGGQDIVNVNADGGTPATVIFPTTFTFAQRLGGLTISAGGVAQVMTGGNRVLATDALTIANLGKLDLSDNDLAVYYSAASPLLTLQGKVVQARNGGSWDGAGGITSGAAKINPKHNTTLGVLESSDYKSVVGASATFDGLSLAISAVLVKYTYYGDTDFNGVVNFDDYSRTDAGFNQNKSGWFNGDFDLNGVVNFDDYSLIDLAFNTQGPALRGSRDLRLSPR